MVGATVVGVKTRIAEPVERERPRVWLTCQNPECGASFWRVPSQALAASPTCSIRCYKVHVYLRARARKMLRERGRQPKRRRFVARPLAL
jgi:hypothetical protein